MKTPHVGDVATNDNSNSKDDDKEVRAHAASGAI